MCKSVLQCQHQILCTMEGESFTDINGTPIFLDCQSHSTFCREFTVTSPKVPVTKVIVFTCSIWLLAYAVFLFTEDTVVLTSAILITLVSMMLYVHLVKVEQETLFIIGSLGVQMSSSYASGRETTTFIELNKIKDIVINEAIYMHQIIYYLCVLLKDPSDPDAVSSVVPLFQSSKPRLNCLMKVYRSCQEILSKCP
ncbi:phosphatidylinositol N-acetylglucosaminyltransferase subunit H isoform X2 [Cynoglossus semilaevis]|nr:phosphatidylinositol N-acetylglucosaminyltransferase subunit H isoform X2 [Cynoglossus semilaevis]